MIQSAEAVQTTGRFKSATEYAYCCLRQLIVSGELASGVRLNQEELASRLELSRMPIRQAILRLESEGLVINRPSRGAVVTLLGSKAILELFEIRSVLEGLAFGLAIPHMSASYISKLEQHLRAMDLAQNDVGNWVTRHDEFHELLCGQAGRSRLADQIRRARQAVAPYVRLYLATHEETEIQGFEHRGLLDAVIAGSAVKGERIMREHIMSVAHGVANFGAQSSDKSGEDRMS